MITVIIAGGSGTRLWPLSTPDFPKHLLKINGESKSLLQNTYERSKKISSAIYVVTDASHAHHVKDQLPDLKDDQFIIEPARRGTASCIVAALAHLSKLHEADEPMAVIWADQYIRDTAGYEHSFKLAAEASQKSGRIVLVGIEPVYPATGFGYIQKDGIFDDKSSVYNVHSFKEKPEFKVAKEYVKSGNYLWNCGCFVATIDTFVKSIKNYAPELFADYESLRSCKSGGSDYKKTYLGFENNTIDYALIEHVKDLLVIPASFDWMDLGSFGDMHKAVESNERGNHIHGKNVETEGVENSFIQNYEDKPIAVIGLDNVVVINSPNGILVARKDLAQEIGTVSKRITNK